MSEYLKYIWHRHSIKYFQDFKQALEQLLIFDKVCDIAGGATTVRTEYGGMWFESDKYLCVLAICWGAADIVPSLWVCAPEKDEKWKNFVETLHMRRGDRWLILQYAEMYGIKVPEDVIKKIAEIVVPTYQRG